ncbi:MAG: Rho termination factor N-terminal domain-containing protein, partial [Streptomyces sp.]|uniref:Rho termination factor N-terminal domain-containing protein n=1 Tax=Streptomyces sp. TaxID=1931 RepID=UPI003D6B87D9
MSDTTDLMGVNAAPAEGGNSSAGKAAGDAAAPATDAAAPASGAAPKRRRSGTGLEGMVLAELQQVASGLGIKGTARMRKSQLIETIKERQSGGSSAGSGPAPAAKSTDASEEAAESRPKRRATSTARTGESAADGQQETQQQIDIPGQPANEEKAAGERRDRRDEGRAD